MNAPDSHFCRCTRAARFLINSPAFCDPRQPPCVILVAMRRRCPYCHHTTEVISFRIVSGRCPSCGYSALQGRVTGIASALRKIIIRSDPWAIGILSVIAVVIPTWVLLDACFHPAMNWALVDLGFPEATDSAAYWMPEVSEKYHQWPALGSRIAALRLIAYLLPICLVLSLARVIVIERRKWRGITTASCIVVLMATYQLYEDLLWMGARHRVEGELSRFQAAADSLLDDWPSQPGYIPEISEYFAHERRPGQIYCYVPDSYSRTEAFGAFVDRLADGGVMFSLEPHYLFLVEYHPHGGQPATERETKYTIDTLTRSDRLTEGWYFTQYSYEGK